MGASWRGSILARAAAFAHVPANLVPGCSSAAIGRFGLLALVAERGLILPKSTLPQVESAVLPDSTQKSWGTSTSPLGPLAIKVSMAEMHFFLLFFPLF